MEEFQRGFLPQTDPLIQLPKSFAVLDELGASLPKLLVSDDLREVIKNIPDLPLHQLTTKSELERAMLIFSFLGHAYIFGVKPVINVLPQALAKPWFEVAKKLERPAVLSYASYALHNWRRFDVKKPIELGNITLLQNFLGGIDEEWFVLVHVDIEAKAAPILSALIACEKMIAEQNQQQLSEQLDIIINALEKICQTMGRMPEHCDPYIYYNRVRPYIHGWKDNEALPDGILYEGVSSERQKFRGETGAQSTIIPMLDAALEIQHKKDQLVIYLEEMKDYMPRKDREFLLKISKIKIRSFIQKNPQNLLKEKYNRCIDLITEFRSIHLSYAAAYIFKQHQKSKANPHATGTGGTPFMEYLKKHRDESEANKL